MSQNPDLKKAPVVAILAPSSLDIVVTFFALNRLGYAALFLSTRLTAPAYSRLLEMANCSSIITTESFSQIIEEIQQERQLQHLSLVGGADYRDQDAPPFRRKCDPVKESHKIGWILHSSGSTGFPKPSESRSTSVYLNVLASLQSSPQYTSPTTNASPTSAKASR